MNIEEIEERGAQAGREEAAHEYPFLPKLKGLSPQKHTELRRQLRQRGRGRAQGPRYELHGWVAKRFSDCWARGYLAQCERLEEERETEWRRH